MKKQEVADGAPKRVTILITCHSHNFRQTIVLWACLSQHLSIRLTTCQVKHCNSFLARAKSQNSLVLVWEQTVTTISATPRKMWHAISWSIPVKSTDGGLIMPENGGSLCGINGYQVFVTDAARKTPNGQGEGQTAKGRLMARIPRSQEGHWVTRRVPKS